MHKQNSEFMYWRVLKYNFIYTICSFGRFNSVHSTPMFTIACKYSTKYKFGLAAFDGVFFFCLTLYNTGVQDTISTSSCMVFRPLFPFLFLFELLFVNSTAYIFVLHCIVSYRLIQTREHFFVWIYLCLHSSCLVQFHSLIHGIPESIALKSVLLPSKSIDSICISINFFRIYTLTAKKRASRFCDAQFLIRENIHR